MRGYQLSVERLVGSESLRSDVSTSRDLTSARVVLDSDVSSRTSTGLIIRGIITCIFVLTHPCRVSELLVRPGEIDVKLLPL